MEVEGLGDDEAMLPITMEEISKGIESWTCLKCGASLIVEQVESIRAGTAIECRYCRHATSIENYRK